VERSGAPPPRDAGPLRGVRISTDSWLREATISRPAKDEGDDVDGAPMILEPCPAHAIMSATFFTSITLAESEAPATRPLPPPPRYDDHDGVGSPSCVE
jgi:hypothetical protein